MSQDIFGDAQEQIGRIVRNGNIEEAYDKNGSYVGYSNEDGTFDASGRRIGDPGLLAMLIR